MTRIVIDGAIFGSNPNGGIARYWTEVLRSLKEDSSITLNVTVPKKAKTPEWLNSCSLGSPASYLAALRADLFHSTYYTRWPRLRCPSVVTVYDFVDACFPALSPNSKDFADRQIEEIKRAHTVIAISNATKKLTVDLTGVPDERVKVAYPAVGKCFAQYPATPDEIAKYKQRVTGGAPYLLHVGRRGNYKNFGTIFRAFQRASEKTDRHLLLIGGGRRLTEYEIDMVIGSGLLERVHVMPHVNDSILRLAYAGADAMVHASLMEGFGIPVVEALACGTGVILSDIPVYREIAENMATFVAPTDVDGWEAAMIAEIKIDTEWRSEVIERFTWKKTAEVHANVYRTAMNLRADSLAETSGLNLSGAPVKR